MGNLAIIRTPDIIAAEINSIKEQTKRMVLSNSIEIGRRLVEAKSLVDHGSWGKWLEERVNYSQRTAQYLAKLFEEYGTDQITLLDDNIKAKAFADLSYTQALALLDIPADERETFVEENNVSDMSTRELQQAIKEKQQALQDKQDAEERLKREQEEKDKLVRQLAKAEKDKEKLIVLEEKLRKKEREAESVAEQYNKLMESLPEDSGDSEELESLRESLSEADKENRNLQKEIAELQRQLEAKPIPAEVITVEERVPEEVQRELERLREEKAIQNLSAAFNNARDRFNDLLDELSRTPAEYRDKYKNAVRKLLSMMESKL